MGTAEIGRELGDAAGPLILEAIATTASIAAGLGTLAFLLAIASILSALLLPRTSDAPAAHRHTAAPASSKPNFQGRFSK